MSVEIEVGLENAAKVRTPAGEPYKKEEKPQPLVNSRTRTVLILSGILAVIGIIALIVYYHNRESTDDAQVDGHLNVVSSRISGTTAAVCLPLQTGHSLGGLDYPATGGQLHGLG